MPCSLTRSHAAANKAVFVPCSLTRSHAARQQGCFCALFTHPLARRPPTRLFLCLVHSPAPTPPAAYSAARPGPRLAH
ncbi:hypothetical protein [Cohnella lubricantis]|uniref:hypothetical protein n=1 Tax=Cohnella lubricantis TaxID=2163172 RepID=UPI0039EF250F